MTNDWRRLDAQERTAFLKWVVDSLLNRQEAGRKEHGDTFHGNPLDHAIEEQLDAIFYLWEEKRRQTGEYPKVWESAEANELESAID
jgi:hypothetical protein